MPQLTEDEFKHANQVYFERCAGCHGVLRNGATGKALTTDITREGVRVPARLHHYGSPGGMPNWGTSGDLRSRRSRYGEVPAQRSAAAAGVRPEGDEGNLEGPRAGRKRPKKQMNKLDLDNLFSVTLRDVGKIALIDGGTKEIVEISDRPSTSHVCQHPAGICTSSGAMPRST